MKFIVCLMLFPHFFNAQTVPGPTNPAGSETDKTLATVEGDVKNAVTGEPVPKVAITMTPHFTTSGTSSYSAITDAKGHFVVSQAKPGLYNVRAARNGFTTQMWGSKGRTILGASLTVPEQGHVKDVLFRLVPQGVITGRVLDEDGDPSPNVAIQLYRHGYFMPNGAVVGGRMLRPFQRAATDDRGEYRIADIPAGTYFVQAIPRDPQQQSATRRASPSKPDERYVPVFYPASFDGTGAAGIFVDAGASERVPDLRLRKTSTFSVRGKVVNETGAPPAGGLVALVSGMAFHSARTAEIQGGGVFELTGVPPGTYSVFAGQGGPGGPADTGRTIGVSKGDIDDLLITLPASFVLSGTMRMAVGAAGSPDNRSLAGIQIILAASDERGSFPAELAADGTFKVPDLFPGKYRLYVKNLPRNVIVQSISADARASQENVIELFPRSEMSVVLAGTGAELEALIQDEKGNPVVGASVSVVPESFETDRTGARHYAINADQTGRVHFYGITPGDYKVFVWEDHDPGEPQDPEFRKPFENRAVRIRFEENARKSLQLKAITVAEIAKARDQR